MEDILLTKLEGFCPLESFKMGSQDKPFMNAELKWLHRKKGREYNKKGKTPKYDRLASLFEQKYKAASQHYIRSKIDGLKETKPGKAYKLLKDMGAQPGDCTDSKSFLLPSHEIFPPWSLLNVLLTTLQVSARNTYQSILTLFQIE